MSEKEKKPERDTEVLLKEYEMCQDAAQSLESTIWQTAAVTGVGSVGTFVLLAGQSAKDQPPWPIAAMIGSVIFVASVAWWFMARRWWSIQHLIYQRMAHIEQDLGMYQTRYLRYLDWLSDKDKLPDKVASNQHLDDIPANLIGGLEEEQVSDLVNLLGQHQYEGVQYYLQRFGLVIPVVWGIYTIWLLLN